MVKIRLFPNAFWWIRQLFNQKWEGDITVFPEFLLYDFLYVFSLWNKEDFKRKKKITYDKTLLHIEQIQKWNKDINIK